MASAALQPSGRGAGEPPPLTDVAAGQVTRFVGEVSPAPLTFEQWKSVGRSLFSANQKLNWQIGDWWAFGEQCYGDRAAAAAEGIFERQFQSLADMAFVCRAFPTSRRREHLSFTHHREVAPLPQEVADRLLDKACSQGLSTRDLRREAQAFKIPAPTKPEQAPPSRPDLIAAFRMVVELAEALGEARGLTERETEKLEIAEAYLASVGADDWWTDADRSFLELLADRRDWIEEAKERFPNRSVTSIRSMMQNIRVDLRMGDKRSVEASWAVDGALGAARLLEALERTGQRPS